MPRASNPNVHSGQSSGSVLSKQFWLLVADGYYTSHAGTTLRLMPRVSSPNVHSGQSSGSVLSPVYRLLSKQFCLLVADGYYTSHAGTTLRLMPRVSSLSLMPYCHVIDSVV